jgi:hypothetical protein
MRTRRRRRHRRRETMKEKEKGATQIEKMRLLRRRAHFLERLRYFADADFAGCNWLDCLVQMPLFAVYGLPDDDIVFVFTIGARYYYGVPDVCLLFPDLRTAEMTPAEIQSQVVKAAALCNELIAAQRDESVRMAEGEHIAAPGSPVAPDAGLFQFAGGAAALARGAPDATYPLADIPRFRSTTAEYHAHGRAMTLAQPRNVVFEMESAMKHAWLGMLYWFSLNFMDTEDCRCRGVLLPAFAEQS